MRTTLLAAVLLLVVVATGLGLYIQAIRHFSKSGGEIHLPRWSNGIVERLAKWPPPEKGEVSYGFYIPRADSGRKIVELWRNTETKNASINTPKGGAFDIPSVKPPPTKQEIAITNWISHWSLQGDYETAKPGGDYAFANIGVSGVLNDKGRLGIFDKDGKLVQEFRFAVPPKGSVIVLDGNGGTREQTGAKP